MSPKKINRIILAAARLFVIFGMIGGVYLYQCYREGRFSETGYRLKTGFLSLTGTVFEFGPQAVLDKKIRETGRITYASGKISDLENNYRSHETRYFSGNILSLEGKTEGDFDPLLRPLIKNSDYTQKIDISTSYCPEDFVPQYPSALRGYLYFMPRTALFDGKTWSLFSCGGKFVCSYSVSMTDSENTVDFGCSGSIRGTDTQISGSAGINSGFDGFSRVAMEISSKNSDLTSTWSFHEENSVSKKISE